MEQALADMLAQLDSDASPVSESDVHHRISALRAALIGDGETPSSAMEAELIALAIHAYGDSDANPWDLHFGPMWVRRTKDGASWENPSLSAVTTEVLAYWAERARAATHPVLRARYADLLWELPKRIEGAVRDVSMARVATDAYLDAAARLLYGDGTGSIDAAQRALVLSLAISDAARIERSRDTLIALEPQVTDETGLGMFGFCFETFLEPPHPKVRLTPEQSAKLVADMERSLATLSASAPSEYVPSGAERAALLLAAHYRRRGEAEHVARVICAYRDAVVRMEGTAAPMVYVHALETLYGQMLHFGLRAEADALNERIRIAGIASAAEMKSITVTRDIPREQVDAFVEGILQGAPRRILATIAIAFIPRRRELEPALQAQAVAAPMLAMMTKSITDRYGRIVAVIGPVDADGEGRYIEHLSWHIDFNVPWLREVIRRGLSAISGRAGDENDEGASPPRLSGDDIVDFICASPCFVDERRPLIQAAIDAYVRADAVTAVHLLIPQIEQAVRQAAILVGAPIYNQRRGGGLSLRTLDELLRDSTLTETLSADITTYLRALLTDARAWNIRNKVCHGMVDADSFTMSVADRVLHSALTLALLQEDRDGIDAADAHTEVADSTTGDRTKSTPV